MQLRDYWVVISKRWWLILLVAFAATLGSYGFSKLQEPVYRSTIKLTVTPSRMDYGLTMVIESLLRQYSERLRTDKIAEAVNARLQLDLPTDTLKGKVRVSPVPEDYILMVTVDDSDPNRARDIAYALADEFVNQQQILMAPVNPTDRIEVSILDRPTPGELFYPKTRQFALAAAALGLVIGLLLAFLLEYLDDTLKTADDVERFASLSVLGAIPVVSSVTPNGTGSGTTGQLERSRPAAEDRPCRLCTTNWRQSLIPDRPPPRRIARSARTFSSPRSIRRSGHCSSRRRAPTKASRSRSRTWR